MSPRFAHARTCRGRIARLRIAVPEDEGRYCLHWIDETAAADDPPRPLYGRVHVYGRDATGERTRALRALGSMTALAAPVTLGLVATPDDDEDWVHWVVADGDAPSLIPPQRASLVDRAMAGSQRWLPGFLIACAVAAASVLWLVAGASDGFSMWSALLILVVSSVATLLTGIMLYEHAAMLLESYRCRAMIEASEAALRRARAQASERPVSLGEFAGQDQGESEGGPEDEREDYEPFPVRRPPARGRKRRRRNGR